MRGVAAIIATVIAFGACGRCDFGRFGGDSGLPLDGIFDANDDANTGSATCNLMSRIADDFVDGARSAELWASSYTDPGTMLAEANGELVITPANDRASTYAGYVALRYYDLREQRMTAEVTQVASGQSSTGIAVDFSEGTYVHLTQKGGSLLAALRLGGVYKNLATIPYDAATQRFWAIAERGGRIYFETSSDGSTFTSFHDEVAPFDVSLVRVAMFAGTDNTVSSPGKARFAAFNGGIASGVPACDAHSFADSFDVDGISHGWENHFTAPCCGVKVTGGQVTITTDGTPGYAGLRSSAGYRLRDDAISIAVPRGPAAASTFFGIFTIRTDAQNNMDLNVRDSMFNVHSTIGGVNNTINFPRTTGENYIQIRETAGTLYFEKSTDRQTWVTLYMLATPFSVDDVVIEVLGGLNGSADQPSEIEYDTYNTP